jgi:hypothetical protein
MTQTDAHKDFDLVNLLHPARAFRAPMDVVQDPDLTTNEKRAILASWASDACAIEDAHDVRQPPGAPLVRFDDVLDALKKLDGETVRQPHYTKLVSRARRWKDFYYNSGHAGHSLFS